MRIGFDAKRYFHNTTGLGNYSRDLVRILSQYFPDNTYVLYNTKPNKERAALLNPKNTFQRLPKGFLHTKFKGLWRTRWVRKQILEDTIDIYHGLSGEIPIGLPENIKTVVSIHDLIFMRYPALYSFFDRKIHFYKFKYAAHKADCVVAISEQTKRDIIQYLQIDPKKIKVVYQGCAAVFKQEFSIEQKEAVIQKFNLPKEFLLNVGTLEERKNVLSIIKAIKDIDTTLVLVGRKTTYFEQAEAYAKQNGIDHKIIHLKNISQQELAMLYQLATVFVYPSIFEGFGIPIIEALFSKTPVITTNSGVFPEAGGPDSLYVDPADEVQLQQKIKYLLDHPEKRDQIASKGFEFVQQFADANIAENWQKIYTGLL